MCQEDEDIIFYVLLMGGWCVHLLVLCLCIDALLSLEVCVYSLQLPVFPMPFEGVRVCARAPEQAEEAKDDEGQEEGIEGEAA